MQVSSSTNNYQTLNSYQQPANSIQPVPVTPEKPQTEASPNDVYKASNGNVIADREGNVSLTPEGDLNVANAQQASEDAAAAETQAKKDNTRGNVVDYTAAQSKKSQAEIYLSVSSESSIETQNNTATIIENLRETQKQNNTVEAYAKYQENQQGTKVLF